MAGGGAHEEIVDVNWAQSEERDEEEEGGSGAGAGIHFPSWYAAAVALVTASCKSVYSLLRSERKREATFYRYISDSTEGGIFT